MLSRTECETFKPQFREPETKSEPNGRWNPSGDAEFGLIDCAVTTAFVDGEGSAVIVFSHLA
jgi:hypothetical protein